MAQTPPKEPKPPKVYLRVGDLINQLCGIPQNLPILMSGDYGDYSSTIFKVKKLFRIGDNYYDGAADAEGVEIVQAIVVDGDYQ